MGTFSCRVMQRSAYGEVEIDLGSVSLLDLLTHGFYKHCVITTLTTKLFKKKVST